MSLPSPIIAVLAQFQPLFTAPTWRKVVLLLVGTLLARGRRTVTAALRQMDQHTNANFSLFHQVLNRARWSALEVSRRLLQVLVRTFVEAGGTVEIVIDETLERRWGRKISKRGHYRDSLLSSKERSVSNSGLRWISMALIVVLPWTKLRWALPFLSVLATTPAVSKALGKRHKTIAQWAQQMVTVVRRWLPEVSIKVIGDSAYSVIDLGLICVKHGVCLIAPLRLDARLFASPPLPKRHQQGRPRVVGKRLPNVSTLLSDPKTQWEPTIVKWYGGTVRKLEVTTNTALWYSTGTEPLPIRWVLTRESRGQARTASLLLDESSTMRSRDRRRLRQALAPRASPTKRAVHIWGWKHSVNGLTWQLNGAPQLYWGSTAWSRCWDMPCILMVRSLFGKRPGIPRCRRPSVMSLRQCVGICGAA